MPSLLALTLATHIPRVEPPTSTRHRKGICCERRSWGDSPDGRAAGIPPRPKKVANAERAARQQGSSFLGRIVPTEAKPSELSGCIVGSGKQSVKNKSGSE